MQPLKRAERGLRTFWFEWGSISFSYNVSGIKFASHTPSKSKEYLPDFFNPIIYSLICPFFRASYIFKSP